MASLYTQNSAELAVLKRNNVILSRTGLAFQATNLMLAAIEKEESREFAKARLRESWFGVDVKNENVLITATSGETSFSGLDTLGIPNLNVDLSEKLQLFSDQWIGEWEDAAAIEVNGVPVEPFCAMDVLLCTTLYEGLRKARLSHAS